MRDVDFLHAINLHMLLEFDEVFVFPSQEFF